MAVQRDVIGERIWGAVGQATPQGSSEPPPEYAPETYPMLDIGIYPRAIYERNAARLSRAIAWSRGNIRAVSSSFWFARIVADFILILVAGLVLASDGKSWLAILAIVVGALFVVRIVTDVVLEDARIISSSTISPRVVVSAAHVLVIYVVGIASGIATACTGSRGSAAMPVSMAKL